MRLTDRGAVFAALGAGALGLGLALGSLVVGAAGLSLVATLAVARITTRAPRGRVSRSVSVTATDEDVAMTVTLTGSFGRGAARIELDDTVPRAVDVTRGEPRGTGRRALVEYAAVPRAPGLLAFGDVCVRFSDALGLVEDERILTAPASVEVHPRVAPAQPLVARSRRFAPLTGLDIVGQAGVGSEFFALREYQSGDASRDVNWRASARGGGKLFVKQREAESPSDVLWLVDARAAALDGDPRTNGWAEALRALATLASLQARRRDRIRIVAYGGGADIATSVPTGDTGLRQTLRPLLRITPSGNGTLSEAVTRLVPTLRRRGAVVVASNLRDASLPEAIGTLRALDMQVTVIACDATDEDVARAMATGATVERWGGPAA